MVTFGDLAPGLFVAALALGCWFAGYRRGYDDGVEDKKEESQSWGFRREP